MQFFFLLNSKKCDNPNNPNFLRSDTFLKQQERRNNTHYHAQNKSQHISNRSYDKHHISADTVKTDIVIPTTNEI